MTRPPQNSNVVDGWGMDGCGFDFLAYESRTYPTSDYLHILVRPASILNHTVLGSLEHDLQTFRLTLHITGLLVFKSNLNLNDKMNLM